MIPNDYKKPDWMEDDKVHNWKNYISDDLKKVWDSFTDLQKALISEDFNEIAMNEEWD